MYCIRDNYCENEINETLDSVSGKCYWTRRRVRSSGRHQYGVYTAARRIAQDIGARVVVDIGCGPATKLVRLFDEGFELYGIDQPPAIELCRSMGIPGRYLSEDLENPTTAIKEFVEAADLVICADVIEHLGDPTALLRYVQGLVNDDSRVVFSTPDRDALAGPQSTRPSNSAHVREWSFTEFRSYLEQSGFRVEKHARQLPCRLGANTTTAAFVCDRLMRGLPWRTCQMAVCRRESRSQTQ
jgi:predicted TPR repeat methyltransferase